MRIPVLVRPVPEIGYRATSPFFPDIKGDGTTAERAVERLRDGVRALMDAGALITEVEIPLDLRAEADDPTTNLGESDDRGIPRREPAA